MTISLGTISDQTLLITARNAGQWLTVGDTTYTAPADGAEIRVYGTGDVTVGPGWWDDFFVVPGEYDGPYFDGDTILEHASGRWTGTPHDSTSELVKHTTFEARSSGQPLKVSGTGDVVLGPGWWDLATFVDGAYSGPPFSGSTAPFEFSNRTVFPSWTGTEHDSTSQYSYLESPDWQPTAEWYASKNRRYGLGVDRGMLYVGDEGYPWSGLISVDVGGPEGSVEKYYLDGQIFRLKVPLTDFTAAVEAYTYPDAFAECIGDLDLGGLVAHGQRGRPFDFCYRTLEGDGEGHDRHYTIHFVWNCYAVESNKTHTTISDSPEAQSFSWEFYGIPVPIGGIRPTSYYSVSTRRVDRALINSLESVLYGSYGTTPALPSIQDIQLYFNE